MTREEAIRLATGLRTDFKCESKTMVDFCNTIIQALEKEPYEDAISRQAVLDAFWKLNIELRPNTINAILNMVNNLPSVNTKKTGRWIRYKEFENGYYHIKCSECEQYWSIDGHAKTFKYCFNCGAKMAESEVQDADSD